MSLCVGLDRCDCVDVCPYVSICFFISLYACVCRCVLVSRVFMCVHVSTLMGI